jgi:hypothetical protein
VSASSSAPAPELDPEWRRVVDRHAAAVAGFLDAAAAVDARAWREPLADGKWSPAQLADHLIRTYEVVGGEVRGASGLRVRTGWGLRQVLRATILRSIMRTGRLPRGAKAPSEIAPGPADDLRDDALERLRALADELEAGVVARRAEKDFRLTHHVFGAFPALAGLEFVAIHTEHHARQLSGR